MQAFGEIFFEYFVSLAFQSNIIVAAAMEMAQDIQDALNKNEIAKTYFSGLPPSHKKAHLEYIDGAKKAATRVGRIEKTIARLEDWARKA